MNILFLSFYSGLQDRGMETLVSALAGRLGTQHRVTVIQGGSTIDSNRGFSTVKLPQNIPLKPRNPKSLIAKLFLDSHGLAIARFTLFSLMSSQAKKTCILIACNGGWQSLMCRVYCWLFRKKLVISGQAGLGWDDRWNLMMHPDLFVAISDRNYRWALKHSNGVNITTIPNGVDTIHFTPEGNIIELNLKHPIVLCVAGSESYKNVKQTIDAIAHHGKMSLLLVRNTSAQDQDVEYGKAKLGERFLCKNFAHIQMPSVYRSCDVFTLVSEPSEAFGISYLEALACGLPVVAIDDELRREILAEAGIYIKDPNNTVQYNKALQGSLSLKGNPKFRHQSLQYSWDRIVKMYEDKLVSLV